MADEELGVLPLLHAYVDEIVLRRALLGAQASIPYAERAKMHVLVLGAISEQERDALRASGHDLERRAVDPRAIVRSSALDRSGVLERSTVDETKTALVARDESGVFQRS